MLWKPQQSVEQMLIKMSLKNVSLITSANEMNESTQAQKMFWKPTDTRIHKITLARRSSQYQLVAVGYIYGTI